MMTFPRITRPAVLTAAVLAIAPAIQAEEDPNFYDAVIDAIFESKCVACHGEDKVKGKLRMDTFEHLMAGGSEGDTVVGGDLEASLAMFRVELPLDDDEHMPPEDKDQLTEEEVAILRHWIESGAANDKKVSEAGVPEPLQAAVAGIIAGAGEPDAHGGGGDAPAAPAPVDNFTPEQEKAAFAALEGAGASLRPLFNGSEDLVFTALNARDAFGDDHAQHLAHLADLLVDVDLSRTLITDAGLSHLAGMTRLGKLSLAGTAVGDGGLDHLAGLSSLTSLNLYGTQVTDAGLKKLEAMTMLQKVYVWDSQATREGAAALAAAISANVNAGWDPETAPNAEEVAAAEGGKPTPAPEAPKPEAAPKPEKADGPISIVELGFEDGNAGTIDGWDQIVIAHQAVDHPNQEHIMFSLFQISFLVSANEQATGNLLTPVIARKTGNNYHLVGIGQPYEVKAEDVGKRVERPFSLAKGEGLFDMTQLGDDTLHVGWAFTDLGGDSTKTGGIVNYEQGKGLHFEYYRYEGNLTEHENPLVEIGTITEERAAYQRSYDVNWTLSFGPAEK